MPQVPTVLKWLTAAVISLWTSLTLTIQLLLLMMALDFLSGLMCAVKCRTLASHISWFGLMKKTAVLIVIGTTWLLQRAIAQSQGVHFAIDLAQTVAIAYIVNETISILENCACVGAPVPGVLRQALSKLKQVMPGEDFEGNLP